MYYFGPLLAFISLVLFIFNLNLKIKKQEFDKYFPLNAAIVVSILMAFILLNLYTKLDIHFYL